MNPPFIAFGAAHLAALAVVALGALFMAQAARRGGFAGTRSLRAALAALGIASWVAENLMAWKEGWLDWQIGLPLHLCDIGLAFAVAALLRPHRQVVELLFFFGFAGTMPALVWPDLHEGFPSFRFAIYFLPHGLIVAASWMLVDGFGLRPRPGSWRRAWLALNLIALAVTAVNLLLGTNFLFLRAKPAAAGPFDIFGPWPVYLLVLEALAALLFYLLERVFGERSLPVESR